MNEPAKHGYQPSVMSLDLAREASDLVALFFTVDSLSGRVLEADVRGLRDLIVSLRTVAKNLWLADWMLNCFPKDGSAAKPLLKLETLRERFSKLQQRASELDCLKLRTRELKEYRSHVIKKRDDIEDEIRKQEGNFSQLTTRQNELKRKVQAAAQKQKNEEWNKREAKTELEKKDFGEQLARVSDEFLDINVRLNKASADSEKCGQELNKLVNERRRLRTDTDVERDLKNAESEERKKKKELQDVIMQCLYPCPKCGEGLPVEPEMAGKVFIFPCCKHKFKIPSVVLDTDDVFQKFLKHAQLDKRAEDLEDIWIVEARALKLLHRVGAYGEKAVGDIAKDHYVTKLSEHVTSMMESLRQIRMRFETEEVDKNGKFSKAALKKSPLMTITYVKQEFEKLCEKHIHDFTETREDAKARHCGEVEAIGETMRAWRAYEDETHPMQSLFSLDDAFHKLLKGDDHACILEQLKQGWSDRQRNAYHPYCDEIFEIAELDNVSETDGKVLLKSRLRLACRIFQCIEKLPYHETLTDAHERAAQVFYDLLLKKDGFRFIPIFTLETARRLKESHPRLDGLRDVGPSVTDSPRVQALGFQFLKIGDVDSACVPVRFSVELPRKLNPISAIARELDRALEMHSFTSEAKDTLLSLGDEKFQAGLNDSGNKEVRDVQALLGFLLQYTDDERLGKLVAALFVTLSQKGIYLQTTAPTDVKSTMGDPIFVESDIKEPRVFLVRFWNQVAQGQSCQFESPFFAYPSESRDGLVGLLVDSSLLLREIRRSSGDGFAAVLQDVVLSEEVGRIQGSAVRRLLKELLKHRGQNESTDGVDELVFKLLRKCTSKYGVEFSPNESEYRELCRNRLDSDRFQHFDIELVEVEGLAAPRYNLLDFGFEGRRAKLKVEAAPAKQLDSRFSLFVDETVWESLSALGLQSPSSFRSARDQHLYHGKNDQLEAVWRCVEQWVLKRTSGQKWVREQLMLNADDWHPLFDHLLREGEFGCDSEARDFAKQFEQYSNLLNASSDQGKREAEGLRDQLVGNFVHQAKSAGTADRDVVTVFRNLADSELRICLVRLLPYLGINLPDWDEIRGKKYDEIGRSIIDSFMFQEGTALGDLVLQDLTIDDEGVAQPIVAASAGPPPAELLMLITELERACAKGLGCENAIAFLKTDLPEARIRGEAYQRQAVQTFFRQMTDAIIEGQLQGSDEDLIYDAMDSYFEKVMSMKLYWPASKSEFGSEWDLWMEINEDCGGQEFECKIPGLKDMDANRPLFKARGNVV